MNEMVFEALKLIIMVCFGFLVAMLTQARSKWADEITAFSAWAKVAVDWAQQVYWAETGAKRKAVVLDFLKTLRNKYKLTLSDEQIEVLLEAAVKQMNKENGVEYVYLEDAGNGDT